jgi:3-oxoacyl-(acyl-carrier-protein) synthase
VVQVNGSVANDPSQMFAICFASVLIKVNGITVTSGFLSAGTPSTTSTGVGDDPRDRDRLSPQLRGSERSRSASWGISRAMRERGTARSTPAASATRFVSVSTWE